MAMSSDTYWMGIDIGSCSVKIYILEGKTRLEIFSRYELHHADQKAKLLDLLRHASGIINGRPVIPVFTGSGGKRFADMTGAPYVQELVANSVFVMEKYPETHTSLEIGGQDSKILFLVHDDRSDKLSFSDMRMNNVCAGGTGAFIEAIASLLDVCIEDFNGLAAAGKTVYDISGRCGVFARTDIQPLLNNGASREDISLSTFHAVAKQIIGGLAQGKKIEAPVLFGGGPFTFNPMLVTVIASKLGLIDEGCVVPDHGEMLVAAGAALSAGKLFEKTNIVLSVEALLSRLSDVAAPIAIRKRDTLNQEYESQPFFSSESEKRSFLKKNMLHKPSRKGYPTGSTVPVYIGIDGGSTTLKYVLIDEQNEIIDSYYASVKNDAIHAIQKSLLATFDRYHRSGFQIQILGCGTTGYSGKILAQAIRADCNVVETIAHAHAALRYNPAASMVIDIGGQDMKAIRINNGVITEININEACSSGCGSFIETYAKSMEVPVHSIAEHAFRSKAPSLLGSRCTVFMNSSIITEQRDGKSLDDILAGLSKSIIENMFTKMIRINNFDNLGDQIVVQGGTFKNDAVLRAIEQYTGKKIDRSPYPEMMGALGAAFLTKDKLSNHQSDTVRKSSFLSYAELRDLSYEKKDGLICGLCANSCSRTLYHFNHGAEYITGNRCERGDKAGSLADKEMEHKAVQDLFMIRERLITQDYQPTTIGDEKKITIGIPLVLEYWNSLPFWKTFFQSLGYSVVVSDKSSYKMYEKGLAGVASDTVCFPAKIAHGHVRALAEKGVDLIFMPIMIKIPAEFGQATNINMCAVVQGYPNVIRISDDPEKNFGIRLETPVFHWNTTNLRNKQLFAYMRDNFGIDKKQVLAAIRQADVAAEQCKKKITESGSAVLREVEESNDFAVLIAARPYHNDALINHHISSFFTKLGVPVLTSDSIPDLQQVDVSKLRIDPVNPFHTRMYAAALYAARHPNLEIVQLVSFGCGHDGIIIDEIKRVVHEVSGKNILVLKIDEIEADAPMELRVRSFIETIRAIRDTEKNKKRVFNIRELSEPFATKFRRKDRKTKIIFTPNISKAHCDFISAITRKAGYKSVPMPIADRRAVELGKKYVHNDLCFPAHINIGEILRVLESEEYPPDKVAIGFGKICDDCRSVQYSVLARKALDEAGYPEVSIVTTGKKDEKHVNPGFSLGLRFQYSLLWGLSTLDAMNDILLATRPYEINSGECDRKYSYFADELNRQAEKGSGSMLKVFEKYVETFNQIPVERAVRRERVLVIGELLMNFKEAANLHVVRYLESNGMEALLPPVIDFLRRDIVRIREGVRRKQLPNPIIDALTAEVSDTVYSLVWNKLDRIKRQFRFYETKKSIHELSENVAGILDRTFVAGEGWIIPAEIVEKASQGIRSFVVVQPFGCLPNHISGIGVFKRLRELYPNIHILSLDYDADTSIANVENRLQMLILNSQPVPDIQMR